MTGLNQKRFRAGFANRGDKLVWLTPYTIPVEPRFNEVPRDWGNWFVISRFFSIHYTITGLKNIVRYTEDFVI